MSSTPARTTTTPRSATSLEAERTEIERHNIRRYFRTDAHDIAWDFIWAAWSSVANQALATLQDVFSLGEEARMNLPARASGNWHWR